MGVSEPSGRRKRAWLLPAGVTAGVALLTLVAAYLLYERSMDRRAQAAYVEYRYQTDRAAEEEARIIREENNQVRWRMMNGGVDSPSLTSILGLSREAAKDARDRADALTIAWASRWSALGLQWPLR